MTEELSCILLHDACQGFYRYWISCVGLFGEQQNNRSLENYPIRQIEDADFESFKLLLDFWC